MADHVRVSPAARIRVVLGGKTIVDTDRGYVVHEGGLPSRYYVPREDVRAELTATSDVGSCPWKGKWRHFDVTVAGTDGAAGQRLPKGAWVYDSTFEVTRPIEGFVSFYPHKVDTIEAQE